MCLQGADFDLKFVSSKRFILDYFSVVDGKLNIALAGQNINLFELLPQAMKHQAWLAFCCTLYHSVTE